MKIQIIASSNTEEFFYPPWYTNPHFLGTLFDVQLREAQGHLYYYLQRTKNNFRVLEQNREHLTTRPLVFLNEKKITRLAIPPSCAKVLYGQSNQDYTFMLHKEHPLNGVINHDLSFHS